MFCEQCPLGMTADPCPVGMVVMHGRADECRPRVFSSAGVCSLAKDRNVTQENTNCAGNCGGYQPSA